MSDINQRLALALLKASGVACVQVTALEAQTDVDDVRPSTPEFLWSFCQ
ncbi:MAG: hypothetical protein E6447_03545 [Bradyrhizobium sp.]|jgi:hypothetical protein|nr:hypothetical protein [Bradyrhizobium sp.]MDU6746795.1 hypothetical protein [Bradyrhizobium sp.]